MRKVYNFFNTKKITALLISCLFIAMGVRHANAQANAGVYDSYIKIAGQDYYLGYSGTIPPGESTNKRNAPAFNGVNFGSFNQTGSTLSLNGGMAYTWRATSGGIAGNICGGNVYYVIYPTGSSKPGFTGVQFNSSATITTVGDYYFQLWSDTTGINTNLLSGLQPGNYTFEVYVDVTGSLTGSSDCNSHIYANGLPSGSVASNYIATFTIKGAACPAGPATGTELLTNGTFDAGNTGFTTDYTYITNPTGNSLPTQYIIGDAAQMKAWNNAFNISGDASGNASGNFMGVDGANTAPGLNVWSETVNVTPNTIYIFSFYSCGFGGSVPAQLYFYADNTPFGGGISTPLAASWTKFSKSWCSGNNTTVTLTIRDSITVNIGNDFGLDSISLRSSTGYNNISAGRDTSICASNSVQLNPTAGACTYLWLPAAGLNHDSIATPVATPTITTTYTLYAVVPGCTDITDTSNVVIAISNSSGILNITASPDSICTGQSSTLSITSGSGSYVWSSSGGLNTTTGANIAVSPTITTSYTVVTAGGGSCTSTGHLTLKVSSGTGGVLAVTASPDSICIGQNSTLAITGGSGAYQWSPSAGLSNSTGAIITVSPTVTTTYSVTTAGGACASSGQVAVKVSTGSGSVLTVTANPNPVNCGDNSVLSVTAGSGNYLWTPTGGTTTTAGSSMTVNPTATTIYNVKAPGGACAATGQVTLTINAIVGGMASAIRDTICQGTPGNLSLAGNSNNIIQWQSSGNNTSYSSIGGATNSTYKTVALQQSTWYQATVDTGKCAAKSTSLFLYVPPALTASFYGTQTSAKLITFNSDSSSGAIRSYHWDFGDGQTSDLQNPSHTFAKDSTYYVCLTLYDGSNCSYTYCRYMSITDGVPTIPAIGNWVVYPDPFSEQLTVGSSQLAMSKIKSIEMYNVLGQLVINKNPDNTTNSALQLDVSSLAKGMYFVIIRTSGADYVQKVVKQ